MGFPLGIHDTLHHLPVARHAVIASSFGLRFQCEGYFLTEAMQPTQAELHVRPDRRVKYDTVAKVLALAQRSGIERIGFTGQEQLLD